MTRARIGIDSPEVLAECRREGLSQLQAWRRLNQREELRERQANERRKVSLRGPEGWGEAPVSEAAPPSPYASVKAWVACVGSFTAWLGLFWLSSAIHWPWG